MGYKGKPGLTLVELVIVVSIITLLSCLSLPHFDRSRLSAEQARIKHDLQVINVAIVQYFFEHSEFPTDIRQLKPYLPGITDLENKYELNPIFGQE